MCWQSHPWHASRFWEDSWHGLIFTLTTVQTPGRCLQTHPKSKIYTTQSSFDSHPPTACALFQRAIFRVFAEAPWGHRLAEDGGPALGNLCLRRALRALRSQAPTTDPCSQRVGSQLDGVHARLLVDICLTIASWLLGQPQILLVSRG